MTGFAVVVRPSGAPVAPEELHALMAPLRRRGPHGDSVFTDGGFGAAASLLDVGDRQLVPAWATEGPFIVAGQIRVDARAALVVALREAGAPATELESDVRLFAKAWSLWQEDALGRLLGDFSVVVHHRESRVTTLARDPFGVRMLFHHASSERIVASNTLAAVLDAGVSRELDADAIADFIADGINENPTGTTFRDVSRVPPAHWLRMHPDGRRELGCYWTLPSPAIDRSRGADEIVAEFRRLIEESVHDRIRSPRLTVFMSGGLDSTTLTAMAARQMRDPSHVVARTAHLPLLAPDGDTARAQFVAAQLGVRHELTSVDDYGYREGTTNGLLHTPEPYDDPDLAAMHDEMRRASAHAPVAFWGEDPDALLAPPHLGDLLRGSSLPQLATDIVAYTRQAGRRPHLGVRDLVRRQFGVATNGLDEGLGASLLRGDLRVRRHERLRARVDPAHPTRSEMARRLSQWHWQPFLESLDAGFHGVPLDVRLPFLDLRLIHFALATPPIPWMQHKHLLREAARGLVPDAVRLAPKRGLPGVYAARLRQWWDRTPAPFVPSEKLSRFIDVTALPQVDRSTPVNDALLHMRLRILDRWLSGS